MRLAPRPAWLLDLGHMPYREAWAFQKKLWARRVAGEIPDTLLLVEHPHVITFGRSGKPEHLRVSLPELQARGVEVFHIERGGDVTYHGPGQLVGYLIFGVRGALSGVKELVYGIEHALIRALETFGVQGEIKEGYPGVWVGEEKIVAIGLAVKRWVSFHGFAFNVNTDLRYFDLIVPCGLKDKGVTSLQRLLGDEVPMDRVKEAVHEGFEAVFGLRFLERAGVP